MWNRKTCCCSIPLDHALFIYMGAILDEKYEKLKIAGETRNHISATLLPVSNVQKQIVGQVLEIQVAWVPFFLVIEQNCDFGAMGQLPRQKYVSVCKSLFTRRECKLYVSWAVVTVLSTSTHFNKSL